MDSKQEDNHMSEEDEQLARIVFVKSPTIWGKLIRVVSRSAYDHVALLVDGYVYEINYSYGITKYTLEDYRTPFPDKPHLKNKLHIEMSIGFENKGKLIQSMRSMYHSGFKYNLLGTLLYPLRKWYVLEREGYVNCIQFVDTALKSIDVDLTEGKFLNPRELIRQIDRWGKGKK